MFDPDYKGDIDADNYEFNNFIRPGMHKEDLEHIIALYDGEIRYTDYHIGLLMDKLMDLDLMDNTIIIITSDHGEEFFEHGEKGHKKNLYDVELQIPLIIRLPDSHLKNLKINILASLVDLMPTILSLLNIYNPVQSNGIDLSSFFTPNTDDLDRKLLIELFNKKTLLGVRSKKYKMIQCVTLFFKELYDLQKDKNEIKNIIHRETAKLIEKEYLTNLASLLNNSAALRRNIKLDEEMNIARVDEKTTQRLKSLGYIKCK